MVKLHSWTLVLSEWHSSGSMHHWPAHSLMQGRDDQQLKAQRADAGKGVVLWSWELMGFEYGLISTVIDRYMAG